MMTDAKEFLEEEWSSEFKWKRSRRWREIL